MAEKRIDLIWLSSGQQAPDWPAGATLVCAPQVQAAHKLVDQNLNASTASYWLFWDATLGAPDAAAISRLIDLPGDVWHAGLRLGMAGKPHLINFMTPLWMLNRDPDPAIEATSWRLSLQACLIKTDVLRQMGGPEPSFETLTGAALELGHRYIIGGVFMRHIPWMAPPQAVSDSRPLPLADELRFMRYRYNTFWNRWAVWRAVMVGYIPLLNAPRAWQSARSRFTKRASYFRQEQSAAAPGDQPARVTALIPTVDRYPYLRVVLKQMRTQTVKPIEIIVIDQTRLDRRDTSFAREFADLPLKIIYQDEAGQCTSRNAGLMASSGEYILFIDDDDEITDNLIEAHLKNLAVQRSDVSSGTADEMGAGPLPEAFRYMKASDVFPTNNTLIRRGVLCRSGLFDLAYNRMARADGDLGMRVYLSGAFMVYNPGISVLHHHAPQGGLRMHKARVITLASSRRSLFQRHLPSPSEIYLGLRYFQAWQVREALWTWAFGAFALHGSRGRKLLKIIIGCVLLPDTVLRIRRSYRRAEQMLTEFPQIPPLDC